MTELDRTLRRRHAPAVVPGRRRGSPSIRSWDGAAAELRVVDVASGRSDLLDEHPSPAEPPAWSPDGTAPRLDLRRDSAARRPRLRPDDRRRLPRDRRAWRRRARRAVLARWRLAELRPRTEPSRAAAPWPRCGRARSGRARGHRRRQLQSAWTRPEAHDWVGGQLALRAAGLLERFAPVAGRFVVPDVALRPGENHLVARATDPAPSSRAPIPKP